jgi:hypothetical protein
VKINVPRLVQDRLYLFLSNTPDTASDVLLARPTENTTINDEGPFQDGPVSPRVAVVDIDAVTGLLRPGAVYESTSGRFDGRFQIADALLDPDVDPIALEDPGFVQQSVFATVYHTLQFFEELLGRRITWAFPGAQLLVVPRAGQMENAFYERESASLQFFEFGIVLNPPHQAASTRIVLTALSHDIVAHETTHAILDGIAPDLYDAISPESLALHESIADLAAIFLTLLNDMVVWSIINISSSSLDALEVLARIAEEFGHDLRLGEYADFLRSADNRFVLASVPPGTAGILVDRHSPHECSQVLTGAVFSVFRRHVEAVSGDTEKKIRRGSSDMAKALFPALDLLPPGEAGFADFARAVSTLAQLSGRGEKIARWFCEELQSRGVPVTAEKIELPPGLKAIADFSQISLQRYAQDNRTVLGIPDRATLSVRVVQRERELGGKAYKGDESIVRIGWSMNEVHDVGKEFSGAWSVRTGLVLVFSTSTGKPLALVRPSHSDDYPLQRGGQLRRWLSDGLLVHAAGEIAGGAIGVARRSGLLTVQSSARTLHIVD